MWVNISEAFLDLLKIEIPERMKDFVRASVPLVEVEVYPFHFVCEGAFPSGFAEFCNTAMERCTRSTASALDKAKLVSKGGYWGNGYLHGPRDRRVGVNGSKHLGLALRETVSPPRVDKEVKCPHVTSRIQRCSV